MQVQSRDGSKMLAHVGTIPMLSLMGHVVFFCCFFLAR